MKRYEKYRETDIEWIKSIPEHWSEERLKNIITKNISGAWGEEKQNNDNDCICLRIADFDFGNGVFKNKQKDELTIRNYNLKVKNKLKLSKGDIVIEKSGGGDKTPVGRTVIFDKEYEALYANFTNKLVVNTNIIKSKYVLYFLQTFYFKRMVIPFIKQTTGIQNLDLKEMLSKSFITIPPKSEQEKIAAFLDYKISRIDKAIELEEKKKEEIKNLKQSIVSNAVTKGLNPDVPLKDSGVDWIGQIPERWQVRKLKYKYILKKGLNITKENLCENGVPVLNYGQIHSKNNNQFECNTNLYKFVSNDYLRTNNKCLLNKGDFVIADTSEDVKGCGNFIYIDNDDEVFAGYHTIILESKNENNKYFAYLMMSDEWRSQIRKRIYGVKVYSITQSILKELDIIIPSISEQKDIVLYLDKKMNAIDLYLKNIDRKIENYKLMKQSLISEVVTGQIDVRDFKIPKEVD